MLSEVQAEVTGRPADTAFVLLLDFDGTLAEFNSDPAAPVLTPERWELLSRISSEPGMTLGIVSGRRLDDLRVRTRLPDHVYHAGLHGLEMEIDGQRTTHPDLSAAEARIEGLAACLRRLPDEFPEVIIEDKGASVAVHTRRLPPEMYERVFARADVLAVPWIAGGHVRRLEGNAVVEYLPDINGHKGEATKWIAERVEKKFSRRAWVTYLGDDLTDEDAFRAIECGIGVLVGLRPTAATYKLDGIVDVDRFLRWLVSEGNVRTAP
ncbi:MAG TPA: trehalose-phosphatase [Vicinamibacterales bacterium]|nr:trehalose-phosphatase [Vicinamibacterales bacterium]